MSPRILITRQRGERAGVTCDDSRWKGTRPEVGGHFLLVLLHLFLLLLHLLFLLFLTLFHFSLFLRFFLFVVVIISRSSRFSSPTRIICSFSLSSSSSSSSFHCSLFLSSPSFSSSLCCCFLVFLRFNFLHLLPLPAPQSSSLLPH